MEHNSGALVQRVLKRFAKVDTRRGFFAASWKVTMGLLGISLLPLLPVDRRIVRKAFAQGDPCGNWKYEGMCGIPCSECGGTENSCPSGCGDQISAAWCYCVCPPSGPTQCWKYIDCCGDSGSCTSCTEDKMCHNNCPQPVWCPSGKFYKCTKVQFIGACPVYTCLNCDIPS